MPSVKSEKPAELALQPKARPARPAAPAASPPIKSPSTAKAPADDKRKKNFPGSKISEWAKKNEAANWADAEDLRPEALWLDTGLPSGSGFEEVAKPGDEVHSPPGDEVNVEDDSDDEAWGKWKGSKHGKGKPSSGFQRQVDKCEYYSKRLKMNDLHLPEAAPKQMPKPDFKPPANLTLRCYTIGWKVSGAEWKKKWKDTCFKGPYCLQKRAKAVCTELQPKVT